MLDLFLYRYHLEFLSMTQSLIINTLSKLVSNLCSMWYILNFNIHLTSSRRKTIPRQELKITESVY